jgi:hypothetical protein
MWGPTFPELIDALPGAQIIDRSSVNVFDDPRVARAIEATGRRKLIFAGLALEVCAAFPAITAVGKGLDAYVAVDACGTFSETKRQVGLLRMMQAGVILSDYATLMIEVLKDTALVTGANKGMGFEIARQIGKSGLLVLVGARNPALGQAAVERLRGEGVDARYVRVDLTEPATIKAAAADIESQEGRLDILVNNAGVSTPGDGSPGVASLEADPSDRWRHGELRHNQYS